MSIPVTSEQGDAIPGVYAGEVGEYEQQTISIVIPVPPYSRSALPMSGTVGRTGELSVDQRISAWRDLRAVAARPMQGQAEDRAESMRCPHPGYRETGGSSVP